MTTAAPPLREDGSPASQGFVNGNGMTNGLRSGRGMTNGRGRTNGLTNGLGRVNGTGLTNGLKRRTNGLRGRTNGLTNGMVNGNGLVNGRGLVNGTRRPLRSNVFGVVTHKDIRIGVSLTLLFVLFLPSFYLLMSLPAPSTPVIRVDGTFGDWTGVSSYVEDSVGTLDSIDLAKYALYDGGDTAYFFFQVRGQLFPGTHSYDGFCAFIDADGNLETGYWPGDLGAEYAVRIFGTDGKLTSAALLRFESAQDRLNWTAWKSVSVVSAASSYDSVEFAVYTRGLNLNDAYTARLAGNDFDGHTSLASLRMGRTPGSLRIEQSPRSSLTPLTPSSNDILHLAFQAQGEEVDIPDLAASVSWESYPPNLAGRLQLPNRLHIKAGEEVPVVVGLDTSALPEMTPVWLNLTGLNVAVPLTIVGPGGVGYINKTPPNKMVDGWFGDWVPGIQTDTSPPITNANVDVEAYASNVTRAPGYEKSLFYLEFVGKAMNGDTMPAKVVWNQGGQPSPPATPRPGKRVSGEDRVTIYIDMNTTDSRGCPVGSLVADFKLEVTGHQRRIDSSVLYICSGDVWSQASGPAPLAMLSDSKMEMSVDLSILGALDSPEILVEATDWTGAGDFPPPFNLDTRSGGRGGTRGADPPTVLHGSSAETVVSLPLSVNPIVDGQCTDWEYASAGVVTETNFKFYVGHRLSRVYVCVIFYDSTNDALDYAELVFDTMHNGTDFPQIDDRRYRLQADTSTLSKQSGDGSGWVNCDFHCTSDSADGTYNVSSTRQEYEFRFGQQNVWNTSNTLGRAGFAVHLFNATGGFSYYWGSTNVDVNKPSTWGHVDIPEFPTIMIPLLIAVAFAGHRRRRRRA